MREERGLQEGSAEDGVYTFPSKDVGRQVVSDNENHIPATRYQYTEHV